ncbi:MAG TPA: DUF6600 domain-containing protein, partial [Alphaproteobacteria bacterium]|nr:DUF6600 domain-containing protein [Alphaproteobacteria bacterium]
MSTNTSWRKLTASALALILASASTVADSTVTVAADLSGGAAADTADAVNLPDPPGRVGRLSFMEGTVSFHAAEQTQWSPATLNFPVTSGDSFWTEPNSKAEIQVGPAEIRMDQRSEIDVVRIDDDATQIALRQGHVNLHLPVLPEGGVEVLTAHGKVMLTQAGRYRIDAGRMTGDRPADRIQVSVLDGEARIDASSGTRVIAAGESVFASGEPVAFTLTTAQADAFDDWARSREPVPAAAAPAAAAGNAAPPIVWNGGRVTPTGPSQTLNYVSPEMTGYQDLDGYGTWATAADYGPLWYPSRVQAGWAPYRYGHWAFVAPWGWTWIDDQPWGFAPFHYGRWVLVHDRWGWCPGSFARR